MGNKKCHDEKELAAEQDSFFLQEETPIEVELDYDEEVALEDDILDLDDEVELDDGITEALEVFFQKNFFKEFKKYDVLTLEEEMRLMRDYKENGNIDARDKLVLHNVKFIIKMVKAYNVYTSDTIELVQAGILGLMEAIEIFDVSRENRLTTYGIHFIRKHILKVVNFDKDKVYFPDYITNLRPAYKKLLAEYNKAGIELTDEDAMIRLNIKKPTLDCLKKAMAIDYTSFDKPVGNDGDSKTYIGDMIPDDKNEALDIPMIEEENHYILLEALNTLNEREKFIVTHLFGFECMKMTSEQLSKKYSVSKERICQIKKNALRKMKKVFENNNVYNAS